jgi:uncharacterized membrane protein
MPTLETQLQRWREAGLLDEATAGRILQFENESGRKGLHWPVILAVGFGTLMLCAGVLLFVATHWDTLSPTGRFSLVLAMVAVFHVAAGVLGPKFSALGTALHTAGTIALGAGIFLAGQIFNLQEHWPGGIMLWALGAAIGWAVLRQWPQALLAALLVPWWLAGEWMVRTEIYARGFSIPAQGLLLLAIVFLSFSPEEGGNKPMRLALLWAGCLALIPLTIMVVISNDEFPWRRQPALPAGFALTGYLIAYVPALVFMWMKRRAHAIWIFTLACWTAALALASRTGAPEKSPWFYLCLAAGAVVLCLWGMNAHRTLFINYGSAAFAITVAAFYFSNVFDKLGRSAGLIGMGILFLLGGWILNRLRTGLIARATAGEAR